MRYGSAKALKKAAEMSMLIVRRNIRTSPKVHFRLLKPRNE